MVTEIEGSDVPKYQQLAVVLRDQILSGEIPPRFPLPSKKQLEQATGLAGGTIDKAIDLLRVAGMVRTVIGLGIFVTDPAQWQPADWPEEN